MPVEAPGGGQLRDVRTTEELRSYARGRLIESRLTPNAISITGLVLNLAAAVLVLERLFFLGGVAFIVGSVMDTLDGRYSRMSGKGTLFGAFLDSTLDRTGEGLVLAGIAFGCAAAGFAAGAGLAAAALAFASVVTYTRAKAEALGLHGEVGFAPRPERLVILAIGLVLAGILGGVAPYDGPSRILEDGWARGRTVLALALAIITALSAVTVVQRILHVKQQLDQIDR
jgi:CDP-diacylglycerol--glycerol-3-phosphate 3-phosphatidyltransferase